MTARRLPNGLIRPEIADWMTGKRELGRLQAEGLDLDLTDDETAALGQALDGQRWIGYDGPVYPDGGRDLAPTPEQLKALDHLLGQHETAAQAIARIGCRGCYIGATRHAPCTRIDFGNFDYRNRTVPVEKVGKDQDQAHGRDQDQAQTTPEHGTTESPDIPGSGNSTAEGLGRVVQRGARSNQDHVRNEENDPSEDWS